MKLILKLVFALTLIGTVGAAVIGDRSNSRCGENEVWSECPSCETSCEEQIKECPLACPVPGCICIDNFVRNEGGKCIEMQSCQIGNKEERCCADNHYTTTQWRALRRQQ
ncbi:hypothetical protein QR680_006289 [Steinernema hermaphroditum]|uniref:TIL domain-containing protein n=1 Tax=Steinernema hermaphroditum TaxID=289476 RepID=A0AA39HXD3_9BILA|nr:hypothetical protein QR680_006289 [Steinernema hermaphroditum]